MTLRSLILILTSFLLVLLVDTHLFSQDLTDIGPVLVDISFTCSADTVKETDNILLTLNDAKTKEDDDIDNELMNEYEDDAQVSGSICDPLYYFNYAMYGFNDFFYFAAIKPIAKGYKAITPTILRKGVKNFFHNLLFPVRFVNNLLQGKLSDAGEEAQIFVVNTTVGVLGFAQVAQDHYDMHTSNEDLGQTFATYSIGEGFYLVWPFLGPSTLRDTIGMVGDRFLTPLYYVDPWELSMGLKAYDTINGASFRIGDYEAFKKAAVNPYAAIKNAYIQNRNKKIKE